MQSYYGAQQGLVLHSIGGSQPSAHAYTSCIGRLVMVHCFDAGDCFKLKCFTAYIQGKVRSVEPPQRSLLTRIANSRLRHEIVRRLIGNVPCSIMAMVQCATVT